jgi:hypothetical protein
MSHKYGQIERDRLRLDRDRLRLDEDRLRRDESRGGYGGYGGGYGGYGGYGGNGGFGGFGRQFWHHTAVNDDHMLECIWFQILNWLRFEADMAVIKTLKFRYVLSNKIMACKKLNETDGVFEVGGQLWLN